MQLTRYHIFPKALRGRKYLLRDTQEVLVGERENEKTVSADDLKQIRRTEHGALLQQVQRVLQADQRIVAA